MKKEDQNSFARNLVSTRAKRASATVLGYLEDNVYEYVPAAQQTQIRKVILDNINGLSDLAMDIVRAETGEINEFWIEELRKIHTSLERLHGH